MINYPCNIFYPETHEHKVLDDGWLEKRDSLVKELMQWFRDKDLTALEVLNIAELICEELPTAALKEKI